MKFSIFARKGIVEGISKLFSVVGEEATVQMIGPQMGYMLFKGNNCCSIMSAKRNLSELALHYRSGAAVDSASRSAMGSYMGNRHDLKRKLVSPTSCP